MGLTTNDVSAGNQVEIWPDNWLSVSVFLSLGTQWRMSHSGISGLDYSVIPFVLRIHRVPRGDWPQLFDDLRVMESETLRASRQQ